MSTHLDTLASTLTNAAQIGTPDAIPVGVSYHPDADPGDGSGWCGEVADWRCYGTLGEVIAQMVERVEFPTGGVK